jgi:hypothetical protein
LSTEPQWEYCHGIINIDYNGYKRIPQRLKKKKKKKKEKENLRVNYKIVAAVERLMAARWQ